VGIGYPVAPGRQTAYIRISFSFHRNGRFAETVVHHIHFNGNGRRVHPVEVIFSYAVVGDDRSFADAEILYDRGAAKKGQMHFHRTGSIIDVR